jgi:hypothetical protein
MVPRWLAFALRGDELLLAQVDAYSTALVVSRDGSPGIVRQFRFESRHPIISKWHVCHALASPCNPAPWRSSHILRILATQAPAGRLVRNQQPALPGFWEWRCMFADESGASFQVTVKRGSAVDRASGCLRGSGVTITFQPAAHFEIGIANFLCRRPALGGTNRNLFSVPPSHARSVYPDDCQ